MSRILNNSALQQSVNMTIRQTEHDKDATELFRLLGKLSVTNSEYDRDLGKLQKEIELLDKGGMRFLTPKDIEKKHTLQGLMATRRATHAKELQFLQNLGQFREQYILNERLMDTKGQSIQSMQQKREQILKFRLQHEQILTDKSKFQRDLFNPPSQMRSAGMNVIMDTTTNNNYHSALQQMQKDEARITMLKGQHMDGLLSKDLDEQLHAGPGDNLYNQAKFLYKGTLSKQPRERLEQMTKLREQLEEYNQGNTKLILPYEQANKDQPNEIKQVNFLHDVDQLRLDYVKSGGTDPNFMLNLSNLEQILHRNQNNNTNTNTDYPPNPSYTPNYPPNPYPNRQPNSFHMGRSSAPNLNAHQPNTARLTGHPIYNYLPNSFKDDLMSYNQPQLPAQPDPKDPANLTSDDQTLDYLRHREAEILSQMSQIDPRSRDHQYLRDQYQEVLKLKATIEKAVFEKRVQEAIDKNQKQHMNLIKAKVNLYDRHAQAVNFSPSEGFALFFDYIANLQIQYHTARINYGIFRKGSDMYPYKQTRDQQSAFETYRTNKVVLFERDVLRDLEPFPDTYIFIELWGYQSDTPEVIGWTMLRLFQDDGKLIIGRYRLPLYTSAYNPNYLFSQALPYANQTMIYGRICLPGDPLLDSSDIIMVESEYDMPEMHIHTTAHNASLAEIQEIYKKDQAKRNDDSKLNETGKSFDVTNKSSLLGKQGDQSFQRTGITSKFQQRMQNKSSTKSSKHTTPNSQASQRTPRGPSLIFKLIKLARIDASQYNDMKLKLGLFLGPKLLEDYEQRPQMALLNMEAGIRNESAISFSVTHEFTIDLMNYAAEDCMIFMGFFKDHKDLVGWLALPIFHRDMLSGELLLRTGAYITNMLSPPGQSPPFDVDKMKKTEAEIDFILQTPNQKPNQLEVHDLYQSQNPDSQGQDSLKQTQRSQVSQVNNQSQVDSNMSMVSRARITKRPDDTSRTEGTSLIKIVFEQVRGLPGNDGYSLKIALVANDIYLYDANGKLCTTTTEEYPNQDQLLLFNEMAVIFEVDFNNEKNKNISRPQLSMVVYIVSRKETVTWFVHDLNKYGRYSLPTFNLPWQKPPVNKGKVQNSPTMTISFDLKMIK